MDNQDILSKIDQVIDLYAQEVIERTKLKTPVQTGKLQDSWSSRVDSNTVEFRNDTDYAAYVEYGTVKMAPVGMLSTTLNESEVILQGIINQVGLNK